MSLNRGTLAAPGRKSLGECLDQWLADRMVSDDSGDTTTDEVNINVPAPAEPATPDGDTGNTGGDAGNTGDTPNP